MPPEGLRGSGRIAKEIAILLVGSDMEGKVFSEQTSTVLLSRHGAGILSQYVLSAEQELILRRVDTDKEAEVRVVGQLGTQGEKYTYGVAFLDPEMDLWGIQFPALTDSEVEARRVLLQCSSCKARELVEQSDLESDVYRINQEIVRSCRKCGSSTIWRRATGEDADESVSLETTLSETLPAESRDSARPENRRKDVRTKVNFKACVRSHAFGDDIVTCEDISRGGLRFKSRKEYTAKTEIEVAAPYSPGTPDIFVHGQIVYVAELKQERRFRCGVCYAKS
jgi:hypothetical protein